MVELTQRLSRARTNPRFAAAVKLGGWVLVAASALFLTLVATRHWDELSRIALAPWQWTMLAGLAAAYGAALFLLGLAWHWLLVALDARPADLAHSLRAYTTAQLAKYVPGNVFHFVGRHMLHSARGGDDRRLAIAAMVENALLVLAALAVALVFLLTGEANQVLTTTVGLALLAGTILVALLAGRLRDLRRGPALAAFAAMLAFFAVMAGVLLVLGKLVGIGAAPAIAGGGIAAWIAGFLTPGAPGGLGVREAVMVIAGGGAASADKLLLLGLLLRVVTFGGDVLCALAGRALPVGKP